MDIETLIPLIFNGERIVNGIIVHLPSVCTKECRSQKCVAFHRSVMNGKTCELSKCHFGFFVRKIFVDGESAAFVGMRIKGCSPKACFNDNGTLKYQFSLDEMNCLIERGERYLEGQLSSLRMRRYLPDLAHSLAKVLDSAENNGHFIAVEMGRSQTERNYQSVNEAAITVGMAAIQARSLLYLANAQVNGLFEEPKIEVSVFSKFVRASHTLRYVRKNAKIAPFLGESCFKYKLSPSFGMIPMLVLDNALKYSPTGGVVDVSFVEDEKGLVVEVTNNGPFVPRECLSKLWENHYRTDGAKKFTDDGSGIGLCTVDTIVRINNVKASVNSTIIDGVMVNGVQMGRFTFSLHIPVELRR